MPEFIKHRFPVLAASGYLALALLAACSSDPEKPPPEPVIPPTVLSAGFKAATDLNPDLAERPSPVVVRVFELKTLGKFETADFYKLSGDYEGALGGDLVASEQFYLHPGETKKLEHKVTEDTHFFAVIAAFRDLDKAVWRGFVPIKPQTVNQIEVQLNKLNITIVPLPADNRSEKTDEPKPGK